MSSTFLTLNTMTVAVAMMVATIGQKPTPWFVWNIIRKRSDRCLYGVRPARSTSGAEPWSMLVNGEASPRVYVNVWQTVDGMRAKLLTGSTVRVGLAGLRL